MARFDHIAVAGGGAWGAALALTAARAGRNVTWWMRDSARAAAYHKTCMIDVFQTPIPLPESIIATTDHAAIAQADALLLAVPAQALRKVAHEFAKHVRNGLPVLSCAKGVEQTSFAFMSDVLKEALPQAAYGALSGPSFAQDVVANLPTAVTLAMDDEPLAADLSAALMSQNFRLYHTSDVIGVEIGGAVKNVLAIGVGVADGLGLGASAKAALIARAFAELQRLGAKLGARPLTLTGLSGLGDLVLTCGSQQSRNFAYGVKLGREEIDKNTATKSPLVEGRLTAEPLRTLAHRLHVEMPVVDSVVRLVHHEITPMEAMRQLLTRPQKQES